MNYKCLVPFIVILSFACLGARVQAADSASHTTTIAARIAPAIEVVSWPDTLVTPADIVPGVPQVVGPLSLVVRSNTAWVVTLRSAPYDRPAQFDRRTATFVPSGAQMRNPVTWSLTTNGPWSVVDTTESVVYSGTATGGTGTQVDLYLKLEASFDDPLLVDSEHEYRMDLSYVVSVTY